MRYYLLQSLEGIRVPDIKNFNQAVNYRAFEENDVKRMPDRNVCLLGRTCDLGLILLSPFPLFRAEAKKSLDLFLWDCEYREFIFLDQKKSKRVVYYLPFFPRIRGAAGSKNKMGELVVTLFDEWTEDIPIIYLKEERRMRVILRLDLLESLMRKGLCGVELIPVQIQRGG